MRPLNAQFLDYIRPAECEFNFNYITCETVSNTLKGMKSKKAAGPDNISVKLLKDSADATVPFLATIFNLSLCQGVFPNDWKNARVSPIYKSGEKDQRGNYWPISVLSVVSKLF